jgi:8-oxoguanine deaminase
MTAAGETVRTLREHSLVFDDQRIVELAPASAFRRQLQADRFDEVITGDRHLVVPGLVNTHHHLYQSVTRCLPAAQNERLFSWLLQHYERWRHLDYEAVNVAAKVSIAELLLHGCTTTSDHFYMIPRNGDARMEAVLDAAEELGIRLHLCRGSMTLGRSHGGLPPDDCVEDDGAVLADCQRALETYHDRSDYAMRRIDLAPCSPFNCTRELLRNTVTLAREYDEMLLHTHLAETLEEERFCLDRYGCRPLQFLADLGFLGPDVYLAHGVHLNAEEIRLLAQTRTGISHNPSSNMRLGSGIAPLRKLLDAGVRVGLGVDGSSSNDGGDLLGEARQALLLARVYEATQTRATTRRRSSDTTEARATDCQPQVANPTWWSDSAVSRRESGISNPESEDEGDGLLGVAEAFKLATIGGAACLNRPVLGHLNPGAAADLAMFRTDDVALAGAVAQDPLAALLLCAAPRAERVFVAGREVVRDGRIVALDENRLAEQLNQIVETRFRG